MGKRLLRLAAVGLVCATTGPAAAGGDGGPGPGVTQGWDGVARGNIRYVAVSTDTGETVLQSISRRTGRVLRFMTVKGSYGIPMVAFDGSADGLSNDGRTLVLGDTAVNPQLRKTSSFAVVDVRKFSVRTVVNLQGDFSFDALSPRARMLYLIQHVSAQNQRKYQVRAYDLGARRLLPQVVIDKRSWEGVMQGLPFARVHTTNGRWVYTLYTGGQHPFVHALDTTHANAVCIDLPRAWNTRNVSALRMQLKANRTLLLRQRTDGKPVAIINVKNFRLLKIVRFW